MPHLFSFKPRITVNTTNRFGVLLACSIGEHLGWLLSAAQNGRTVYEVVLEKDSEISKVKKEKYKSLALKARKISSDEEVSCSKSDDEEYAMACGDPNHFISDCPKHSYNDQKAFVVGCWSDSEDDSKKEEICLMALDNNEVSGAPHRISAKLRPAATFIITSSSSPHFAVTTATIYHHQPTTFGQHHFTVSYTITTSSPRRRCHHTTIIDTTATSPPQQPPPPLSHVINHLHYATFTTTAATTATSTPSPPSPATTTRAPSGGVTDWYQSQGYREPGRYLGRISRSGL
ncbi:hypothetical protein Tco_0516368 [Tanacetum coccineum]